MALITTHYLPINKYLISKRITALVNNVVIKCHQSTKSEEQELINQIFPDIEGSPKSLPDNYPKLIQKRRRWKDNSVTKTNNTLDHTGKHVIIECKDKTLNHHINQRYNKFETIPLASKGWLHRLSKGDFFKINILPEEDQRENVFWSDEGHSFEDLGLKDDMIKVLNKLGFTTPTHVQAAGIPAVLKNQNTLLAGETGCGKTLAFLLPLVQEILAWRANTPQRKLNSPLALVLVPGRELAFQIGDVADQLARELLFDLEVNVGGHTKRLITHPSFRPVDLFIGSLGAASKLTTSGIFNMSYVRHVVLDEADTMLDDSFNSHLVRYLKKFPISYGSGSPLAGQLPKFCKLTMASATMPTSIANILGDFIVPESLVKVQTPRLHQVLCHVPQTFLRLGQSQKPTKLLEIVKKYVSRNQPIIIFSNRTKVCDWVSMFLNENGVSCINLNGDMPSDMRSGRFDMFQRGFVDVISCTDVASRGLDTVRAKQVINYDFPIYVADYIHRCGRLGRVGHVQGCHVTNFVSGDLEVKLVQKVESAVRTMSVLPNVNANITRVIDHKVLKSEDMM